VGGINNCLIKDMADKNVLSIDGSQGSVTCNSVACPACGTLAIPLYLCYDYRSGVLFCRCPVDRCGFYYMIRQQGHWVEFLPNHPWKSEGFGETINNISPGFVKIYNEAFAAEQMSLMEVCGVGYRKALEFLIKDYVIVGKEPEVIENIKKMQLAQCIENYVTDLNVKNVSKRAVWLGNDETHYVRKWEEKDVQDLKGLIRLTIRWIEQEKETASLLEDMPEGR